MEERDTFPFGSDARRLVDETEAGSAAAVQHALEVIHGEADVVNPGAALRDEPADGRLGRIRLEQFDEGFAGREARDACAVGVCERDGREAEDVAAEGKEVVDRPDRESDVRDPRTAGSVWHGVGAGDVTWCAAT